MKKKPLKPETKIRKQRTALSAIVQTLEILEKKEFHGCPYISGHEWAREEKIPILVPARYLREIYGFAKGALR